MDLEVSSSCLVLHFLVVLRSLAPNRSLDTLDIIKSATKKYNKTFPLTKLELLFNGPESDHWLCLSLTD